MGRVNAEWLSQLAHAHAPVALSRWWPLAPVWWVLITLLVTSVVALIYYVLRPTQRMRRTALREHARLANAGGDDASLARGLEHLLRRYAVARFGRGPIALLSGDRWISFMVVHGGADLAGEAGASLLRLAYGGQAVGDRLKWLAGTRAFLKDRS